MQSLVKNNEKYQRKKNFSVAFYFEKIFLFRYIRRCEITKCCCYALACVALAAVFLAALLAALIILGLFIDI